MKMPTALSNILKRKTQSFKTMFEDVDDDVDTPELVQLEQQEKEKQKKLRAALRNAATGRESSGRGKRLVFADSSGDDGE